MRSFMYGCVVAGLMLLGNNVAQALERAAALPYVYEVTKQLDNCGTGEFLTVVGNKTVCAKVEVDSGGIKMPACTAGQFLTVAADKTLTCKTVDKVCAAGEALTKVDDGTFTCTTIPTTEAKSCGTGKMLRSDGNNKFSCVDINIDIGGTLPDCASTSKVLTNIGGTVQCVSRLAGLPTNCADGNAITVEGGVFSCTTFTTGTLCAAGSMALINKGVTYCVSTSCAENERLTFVGGKPVCKDLPAEYVLPTCSGASLTSYDGLYNTSSLPIVRGAYALTAADKAAVKAFKYPIGSLAYVPNADGSIKTYKNPYSNVTAPLLLTNTVTATGNAGTTFTACTSRIQCTGVTGWRSAGMQCSTTDSGGGGNGSGSDGMGGY